MTTPNEPVNQLGSWKRIAVRSFFFDLGVALFCGLFVSGVFWYVSRPKPEKPWNTAAIIATYDYIETHGEDDHLMFCYVLENTTDHDYRIENNSGITIAGKLAKEKSLSEISGGYVKTDYPIFVPTKQRSRFFIEIPYPSPIKLKGDASPDERKSFRRELEKYAETGISNLDGFMLFDSNNRYQINVPKGW